MTRVFDNETEQETIDVFIDNIDLYLSQFCEEYQIEDLRNASQNVWNAAMVYVQEHVFNYPKCLKIDGHIDGYVNTDAEGKRANLNQSNCNAYDFDKINPILKRYHFLCDLYNKGKTITAFCLLTGISESTVYGWGEEGGRKLSTSGLEIYQKLQAGYEDSGESKLWSNKNPVAQMAIMNRRFGWNLPGVSREKTEKKERSPEQIAEQYGDTAVELPELPDS